MISGLTFAAIGSMLLSTAKTVGKGVLIGGIFIAAFSLLPVKIGLPYAIYGVLVGENIFDVIYLIGYIMPVDFMLNCLLILLFTRYFDLISSVVSVIFDFVKSIFVN